MAALSSNAPNPGSLRPQAIMSSDVQFAKDEENKLDASHLAQVLLSKGYEEHCSQPKAWSSHLARIYRTPILHIYDPGTSTESKQASNCTLLSKIVLQFAEDDQIKLVVSYSTQVPLTRK
uniref:Uncharacterized protein n=1 Tax=Oryza nivara TaxID=4536 RepID=A0A0E0HCM3_ORYNI